MICFLVVFHSSACTNAFVVKAGLVFKPLCGQSMEAPTCHILVQPCAPRKQKPHLSCYSVPGSLTSPVGASGRGGVNPRKLRRVVVVGCGGLCATVDT